MHIHCISANQDLACFLCTEYRIHSSYRIQARHNVSNMVSIQGNKSRVSRGMYSVLVWRKGEEILILESRPPREWQASIREGVNDFHSKLV